MVSDPETLYKLMMLSMLIKVDYPLSNAQMSDFLLQRDYMNYFAAQEALTSLEKSGLITRETFANTSLYHISDAGRETFGLFAGEIPEAIEQDIAGYIEQNGDRLRSESSITAQYEKLPDGQYLVRCRISEKDFTLAELKFTIPTEEAASTMCNKWKSRSDEIYEELLSRLLN